MQYVKFGNTGMDVSRICLGMMSFGKPGKENGVFPWAKTYEEGKDIFKKAIDLGINYFDTANVYQMGSSEEITGRFIRDFGLNRDEIVVATKVNFEMRPGRPNGGGLSRKNIMAEIDHSLERLGMDYVDVYQIHRLDSNTRQSPLHRRVYHFRLAAGTPAGYCGAEPLDEIRFPAAPIQPDLPGRRTGNHAFVPGPEDGCGSLEPAGRRSLRPSLGHRDRA